VLRGVYTSADPDSTIQWFAKSKDRSETIELVYPTNVATPLYLDKIVVRPGVLTSGKEYTFYMVVTNS
jgi:hypothetical protein